MRYFVQLKSLINCPLLPAEVTQEQLPPPKCRTWDHPSDLQISCTIEISSATSTGNGWLVCILSNTPTLRLASIRNYISIAFKKMSGTKSFKSQ